MSYFWYAVRILLRLILRRPLVGACVIPILSDGSVVLIRRKDSGRWGLPGGLIDWGEDIVTAARRELVEETGLRLIAVERLVGVYSAPYRDSRFHSICVALATTVEGTPEVADPQEVLEVQAFSLSEVSQLNLSHDHTRQLQDYVCGRTTLA